MGEFEGDAADTVIRRRPPGAPGSDPGPPSAAPQPHGDEPPGDDTVIRLVEPFLPSRSRVADRPVLLLDSLLPHRPGDPGGALDGAGEAPSIGEHADFALRVPGVEHPVLLDLPVVIGRRPGASRVPEIPAPRRIVVPADRQGVSGRHARIEQLGVSVVVTDLGSSNGTVVHLPTGPQLRLRPGESCVVLPDSTIALGDGIDIVVMAVDRPQPSRRPS